MIVHIPGLNVVPKKRLYEIGRRLAESGNEVNWYCIGWWLPKEEKKDIEFDGIG